jgi:hypothetical protein
MKMLSNTSRVPPSEVVTVPVAVCATRSVLDNDKIIENEIVSD